MDFELTADHKNFQDRARRFAEAEITPRAADLDAGGADPAELAGALARENMMGVAAPVEDGGCGEDPVSYILALMEVSRACASTGALMLVQNSLYGFPLVTYGTQEQKRKYLHPCTRGEAVGVFALSEKAAGSDLSDLRTTAVRTPGGWGLSGEPVRVTGGGMASFCMLPALQVDENKPFDIGIFVVDLQRTLDFRKGPREETHGLSALGAAEMIFLRSEVPAEGLVGNPGEGRAVLRRLRARGWVGGAAHALGIGRAVMEESLRHAKERELRGKPLFSLQGVQWRLADMAMGLEAAELLALKAAWLEGRGKPFEKEAAMAAMSAAEAVLNASVEGFRIVGDGGCARGTPMERHLRDAKMVQVRHGTFESMRSVVSGHLVLGTKRST